MRLSEVKKRLVRINGTELPNKAGPMNALRRGNNYVKSESEYEAEEHDTFFDFESDLAEVESARKQVERLRNQQALFEERPSEEIQDSFFTLDEEDEVKIENNNSFFILDDIAEESKDYTDVTGFEFKYCKFIKKDGEQCKRQAPKENDYCSAHRKYLKKQSP